MAGIVTSCTADGFASSASTSCNGPSAIHGAARRTTAAHHVSVRYLHLLFAQHRLGVREWIVRERLEGARRHLATDPPRNSSIAAIGRRWGFCDAGHFARRFRHAYGVSPRKWRQRHHDR